MAPGSATLWVAAAAVVALLVVIEPSTAAFFSVDADAGVEGAPDAAGDAQPFNAALQDLTRLAYPHPAGFYDSVPTAAQLRLLLDAGVLPVNPCAASLRVEAERHQLSPLYLTDRFLHRLDVVPVPAGAGVSRTHAWQYDTAPVLRRSDSHVNNDNRAFMRWDCAEGSVGCTLGRVVSEPTLLEGYEEYAVRVMTPSHHEPSPVVQLSASRVCLLLHNKLQQGQHRPDLESVVICRDWGDGDAGIVEAGRFNKPVLILPVDHCEYPAALLLPHALVYLDEQGLPQHTMLINNGFANFLASWRAPVLRVTDSFVLAFGRESSSLKYLSFARGADPLSFLSLRARDADCGKERSLALTWGGRRSFLIDVLAAPHGKVYVIVASHPRAVEGRLMRLEIREGEDLDLVAHIPLPGAISGTGAHIPGADGRPVASAVRKDGVLVVCDYLCWLYVPDEVRQPAGASEWARENPDGLFSLGESTALLADKDQTFTRWTGPSDLTLLDNGVLIATWSDPHLRNRPTFAYNIAPLIYYPNDRPAQQP